MTNKTTKQAEYDAAVKKATELNALSVTAANKAQAAGATDADKTAASKAFEEASKAAEAAKKLEAELAATGNAPAKKSGIKRILNYSKALQYVGDIRILPDDVGSEFSDEQHEAALANPGYAALIKQGLLKVE